MAKVIEFYVQKNFRNAFVRAGQPQPGTVIEFSSQAKKSVPTRPAGGVPRVAPGSDGVEPYCRK